MKKILDKFKSSEHLLGAFWTLFGSAMIRGGSLILTFILARFLGAEALGKFSITKATIFTVTSLLGYFVSTSGIKYISQEANNFEERSNWSNFLISISILINSLFGIILFIISKRLSLYFFNTESYTSLFQIASVLVPFVGISNISQGIIIGAKKFKKLGIYNALIAIITIPTTIVFSLLWGVKGALVGLVVSYGIEGFIKLVVVKNEIGQLVLFKKHSFNKITELIKFSSALFLIAIITGPFTYVYKVLLLKTENGLYELGIYEALIQWNVIIMMITGAISTTSLPLLGEKFGIIDSKNFTNSMKKVIQTNALAGITLTIIFLLLKNIILSAYGPEFIRYNITFTIILMTTVFNSLTWSIDKIFYAINLQWKSTLMFGISTGVTIISFLLLRDEYGIMGLAIANLAGWVAAFISGILILRQWTIQS